MPNFRTEDELIKGAQRQHRQHIMERYRKQKTHYETNKRHLKRLQDSKYSDHKQIIMYMEIGKEYETKMLSYVNDFPEYFV